MKDRLTFICTKTIEWSLIFIVAAVPLIINPFAFDLWYRPKISSVQTLLIIAGIACGVEALINKRKNLWHWNTLNITLLCYAAAAILSTIFSIHTALSFYGDPLRMEGLCTVATYVALVFLFQHTVQTKRLAARLFYLLIMSSTLISIYALFQYFCFNPTEHYIYKYFPKGNGIGSTIGNPNFLGKYLVLILPIALAFYLCASHRFLTAGLFCCVTICFAALIATFTRASWLGVLIGIGILWAIAFKNMLLRDKIKRFGLIIFVFIAIVTLFNIYPAPHNKRRAGSPASGAAYGEVVRKAVNSLDINRGRGVATRLYVWEKAVLMIEKKPWFGYGLETFMLVMQKFNKEYMEMFHDRVIIDRAHNNYLDTAFSMGITGLAAYLAVLWSFLMYVWRTIWQMRNTSQMMLFLGIFSAFCGYLINDLFIFSVVSVSPTFWSLMGITIASGRIMRSDQTEIAVHPLSES